MRRRGLLVGAGGMGRAWGRLLANHSGVELVGWVDLVPEVATKAAADLGLDALYIGGDLAEAIAATQPDFMLNVTVPAAHLAVSELALRAGLPVLSEKPLAGTLEEAKTLVRASEETGQLLMVSQNRRYHRGLAGFRQLVQHHLGRIGLVDAGFYLDPHFGGFREEMDSPLLVDMAIHTFDAARYVTGADPVTVYCDESDPPWSWYRGAAAATAIFELTDGVRFSYHGCWCAPGRTTSWESEWRVVGEAGTATWDGHEKPQAELVDADRQSRLLQVPQPELLEGIEGSLADFLQALDGNHTPMGECHDNIKSLAMVQAAVESSRRAERMPVAWG